MSRLWSDYRLHISFVFLVLGVAGMQIARADVPSGPWEGLYRSFPLFWGLMLVALAVLIGVTVFGPEGVRPYTVFAVPLLAVLVAVPTLKWGVPYGIRDPWIHLDLIKSQSIFRDNKYPMLHSLLAVIVEISGLPPRELLARVQIIGPAIGSVWVFAVVRCVNRSSWHIAGLTLFPVCYMWITSRPYAVAPLFSLLVWMIIIGAESDWRHSLLLLILITVSVWWHPVAGILIGFILFGVMLTRKLSEFRFLSPVFQPAGVPGGSLIIISGAVLGIVLIWHLVYNTLVVEMTLSRAFITSAGDSGGGSPQVVGQLTDNILEVLRRAMFVLAIGIAGFGALLKELSQRRVERVLTISIIATAVLAVVFLALDLLPGLAFGVRRGKTLAPLLLVPAGAIALRESSILNRRLLMAVLILSTGIAVAHSSPIIGGGEGGSTMSDVQSVKWLQSYQGDRPIVGSENTIYIAQGLYGDQVVKEMTNGHRFRYQTARRPYENPWTYDRHLPDSVESAYVVLSKQYRVSVRSAETKRGLQLFSLQTDRIYSNGNVWIHNDT